MGNEQLIKWTDLQWMLWSKDAQLVYTGMQQLLDCLVLDL